MLFRKFFVCAALMCFGAQARYVSWFTQNVLRVCEDNGSIVGQLSNAAQLPQSAVFEWLSEQNCCDAQAVSIWISGAYTCMSTDAWRWQWPVLFLARGAKGGYGYVHIYGSEFSLPFFEYKLSGTPINVENITAGQLSEKLGWMQDSSADQILREFGFFQLHTEARNLCQVPFAAVS